MRHFIRHYVEMWIAMALGMGVLGAASGALSALGVDVAAWRSDEIELELLLMAAAMSVPMVAWMRYRGHGWAPAWEMTAAMFVPSLGAIALLWAGTVTDDDALMMIQHVAMIPAMLVPMLLRREEYSHDHGTQRLASSAA
jgi:hypothetical protein